MRREVPPGVVPDDVLFVAVQPYTQRAEVVAQARAMIDECRRRGIARVLAETALLGDRIDIVDRILVGVQMPDFWPGDIRLALLCTDVQMLPTLPFEHAASGRGTPIRVFVSRDEALRWLRER
ncbi:MAG TPA: hypothetical protein VFL14_08130 [Xanthomonadales bacterium]|nr:hypothetical protein [Xanthomonadales bacterium]